jgi:outer membrane protein assembly factor BamE
MMSASQSTRKPWSWAIALVAVLLGACAYKLDIQQGNHLDEKLVDQVKEGMTRKQVRFLLGTPMIEDPFHEERWDYVYYLKPGRSRKTTENHLIIHFEGDTVARIERVAGYSNPEG